MKKLKFVSLLALVCTMMCLVITSCNKEEDPKHPIHNVKFYCDYDRGGNIAREYFYFGSDNNFEYGWEIYENGTNKPATYTTYETGTYDLYDAYIELHYAKQVTEGEVNNNYEPRTEKVGYKLEDDTLTLTLNYGTDNTYTVQYYKK